jgi:hypothetical protein
VAAVDWGGVEYFRCSRQLAITSDSGPFDDPPGMGWQGILDGCGTTRRLFGVLTYIVGMGQLTGLFKNFPGGWTVHGYFCVVFLPEVVWKYIIA